MKLYKTYALGTEETLAGSKPIWTTSEAKAASERARLSKLGHKRDNIMTEEVEVSTKRNDLVTFLNGL